MGVSVWYYTTLPTVDGGFFNNNPDGFKRLIEDLGGWVPDNNMISIDIDVLVDCLNKLAQEDQEEAFEYDSNCTNGMVYEWLKDALNNAEEDDNYIYFTIN